MQPVDRAGNNLPNARPIELTATSKSYRDFLNPGDRNDLYRFTLRAPSQVNLFIRNVTPNTAAEMQLLDGRGRFLFRPGAIGGGRQSGSEILDKGTYYIRVFHQRGSLDYRMGLSATPFQDLAGNTPSSGYPIAVGFDDISIKEFVGSVSDPIDYYVLDLRSDATLLEVDLDGNFSNFRADLLNEGGTTVETFSNNQDERFLLQDGLYYLRVRSQPNRSASYTLKLSGQPIVDLAGDRPSDARFISVSSSSRTYEDYIGTQIDDFDDFYRFNLSDRSTRVRFDLSSTDNRIRADLFNDFGQRLTSFSPSSRSLVLRGDTYFLRIRPEDAEFARYRLQVSGNRIFDGGFNSPFNAPFLNPFNLFRDFVGSGDEEDYFRFTVPSKSILTTQFSTKSTLSDRRGDAAYTIFTTDGRPITGLSRSGLSVAVAPGTYYVKINSLNSSDADYSFKFNLKPPTLPKPIGL